MWKHYVYDGYYVFMGLIFWVWEIGTHVFSFFVDKVTHVFLWRRKERKRMKEKEKKKWPLEWVCKEERKKEKEKRRRKKSLSESMKKKGEKK